MIILDTNVISGACRRQPEERIVRWLDAQEPGTLYICTMSLAEVFSGIAQMPQGQRREKLREATLHLFEELFDDDHILPFDAAAADAYATMQAKAKAQGTPIGVADGIIAATAISRGFAVASGDVQPFKAAGVELVNPWE